MYYVYVEPFISIDEIFFLLKNDTIVFYMLLMLSFVLNKLKFIDLSFWKMLWLGPLNWFLNCSHDCLLYFSFLCYNRLLYYFPSVIYMKIQSDCFLIYLFDTTMKYATFNYICLYYLHCTVMKTTISRFFFRRCSRCTTWLFIVLNNCTVNDCQNKWHINIIPFISLKLAAMTVLKTKKKKER